MSHIKDKQQRREVRHRRLRASVTGTASRPRLAVFKSNRFVYAQLIDDTAAKTLLAADSRSVGSGTPLERATAVGAEIAKQAKAAGIAAVVFDRGGFQYLGIIAAVADGAREGGLTF